LSISYRSPSLHAVLCLVACHPFSNPLHRPYLRISIYLLYNTLGIGYRLDTFTRKNAILFYGLAAASIMETLYIVPSWTYIWVSWGDYHAFNGSLVSQDGWTAHRRTIPMPAWRKHHDGRVVVPGGPGRFGNDPKAKFNYDELNLRRRNVPPGALKTVIDSMSARTEGSDTIRD
jgi:hypothetical protein